MKRYIVKTFDNKDNIATWNEIDNLKQARLNYKEAKENTNARKVELVSIKNGEEKIVYSKVLKTIVEKNNNNKEYSIKMLFRNNVFYYIKRKIDWSSKDEVLKVWDNTINNVDKQNTVLREVQLICKNNDETIEVIKRKSFSKFDEFKSKINTVKEEVTVEENDSAIDNEVYRLCKTILSNFHELDKLEKKHTTIASALTKKQDLILHNIENMKEEDLNIDILKKIKQIRYLRRVSKNNAENIQKVKNRINDKTLVNIKDALSSVKKSEIKHFNIETEEDWRRNKRYEEIAVTEGDNIQEVARELTKKYRKIVYDNNSKKIYAYNNVKQYQNQKKEKVVL